MTKKNHQTGFLKASQRVGEPIVMSLMLAFNACLFLRLGYDVFSAHYALFIAPSQGLDQHFFLTLASTLAREFLPIVGIALCATAAIILLIAAFSMVLEMDVDLFSVEKTPTQSDDDC